MKGAEIDDKLTELAYKLFDVMEFSYQLIPRSRGRVTDTIERLYAAKASTERSFRKSCIKRSKLRSSYLAKRLPDVLITIKRRLGDSNYLLPLRGHTDASMLRTTLVVEAMA